MDLILILQRRLDELPTGDYLPGLHSVFQHIQVAAKHLIRGNATRDETAFTDAIYRTNQAFEGSLKEAYRVLVGKDPHKVRPFDIENYFQNEAILRPRVVSQLSIYRTEWRNPSTHDYNLDFDEDEALLAIVTVCSLSIVLIDQIIGKVNFEKTKARTSPASTNNKITTLNAFVEHIAGLLKAFKFQRVNAESSEAPREIEIIASLAGYLTASLPGLDVEIEKWLSSEHSLRSDLFLRFRDMHVVMEVKRARTARSVEQGLNQLATFLMLSQVSVGILYISAGTTDVEMVQTEYQPPAVPGGRVVVIAPEQPKQAVKNQSESHESHM